MRRDWQELTPDRPYDAVAAIGVLEHVGRDRYAAFCRRIHDCLRPGGRAVLQAITHPTPGRHSTGMTFLQRHVFPGGELGSPAEITAAMTASGLVVKHVEAFGAHYVHTTRHWLERLQARAADAVALVGERRYRTWVAYLAPASVAFEMGSIDVQQFVGVRPHLKPTA